MKIVIKRILQEIKPYKQLLTVVIIAGILQSLAESSYPLMIQKILDYAELGNKNAMTITAGTVILISLIGGISRYFHIYLMNYVSEIVANNYRRRLQEKFMSLNLTFYNNYNSGSGGLISRILTDIIVVKDGLRMYADFFREPIKFVLLFATLFWMDWRLTTYIIVLLPLILWLLKQLGKSLRKYSELSQKQVEHIASTVKESLDGVRVIQSFNLHKLMKERFYNETEQYLKFRKIFHSRLELSGPVTEWVASVLVIIILFYMGSLIADGKATIGLVIGYTAALVGLSTPIKKMQESYVRIQESVVAAKRIYSLLDEKSEVPQIDNPEPFPKTWQTIEYKNVSFSYGNDLILNNFNLTINRGEVIAFVGESGSGKSTVVNLLERFFDPTQGTISIGQVPIQNLSLEELREHVALVTQDVFLFSDTIANNIMGNKPSHDHSQVIEAAKNANAHSFIEKMPEKYNSRVGERGSLLSGGERQRISIARAMYKNSPILILDEATSALDSASEIEVQKGLDLLMTGRTTLVIAHRLSTIQNADRIVVIRKGQIVEIGKHAELLEKRGEYYKFHSLQHH